MSDVTGWEDILDRQTRKAYRKVAVALIVYPQAERAIAEARLDPLTVEFFVARFTRAERSGLTPIGPGEPPSVAETLERVLDVAALLEPAAAARVRADALGVLARGATVGERSPIHREYGGEVNPFFAAGLRAAMRRRGDDPRNRPSMWALLFGELRYLARRAVASPVARVWAVAIVASLAVLVGLSDVTPGPVVAEWLRLTAVAIAIVLAAVTVWAAADRWGRTRPGVATVAVWSLVGAVGAYVVIGLHEQTPGPVLDATVRWLAAGALFAGAAIWRWRARGGR